MLYKFKSKAAGDVIMLAPQGQRVMEAWGKVVGAPGIVRAADLPAAIAEAAASAEIAERERVTQEALTKGEPKPLFDPLTLAVRFSPLIDHMKRAIQEQADLTW
jgi:Domain of unknown function (DUF1840)